MYGILGSILFYDYSATKDCDTFLFSLSCNNTRHVNPIQTTQQINYMSISARCQLIKYCIVDINEAFVVLSSELCKGS